MASDEVDGLMLFKNGKWVTVEKQTYMNTASGGSLVGFHDIKYFYANIIDYSRVVLCCFAAWTMIWGYNFWTAFLIMGSILLDWVDGPVARMYNQCTIFGSGIDWLADVQAQVLTLVWWTRLDASVSPWMFLAVTIELAACIFDFATTATLKYPVLGRKRGFLVILEWSMPSGSYTWFGTFLWLAYPIYTLSRCLNLSWPERSSFLGFIFFATEASMFIPAIMYIWCELAYFIVILNIWAEPRRDGKKTDDAEESSSSSSSSSSSTSGTSISSSSSSSSASTKSSKRSTMTNGTKKSSIVDADADADEDVDLDEKSNHTSSSGTRKWKNDGYAGFALLGSVPAEQQELLKSVLDETKEKLGDKYDAAMEKKEIYWINLWQARGESLAEDFPQREAISKWIQELYHAYYDPVEDDLDGYGFIINPVGSRTQAWHVDYALGYSTIFIPITPITPQNCTQYAIVPTDRAEEVFQKYVKPSPDNVDLNSLVEECEFVSVRQMLARPFSMLKMDFRAIHRGISNTENYHRVMFYASCRKRNTHVPAEAVIQDFENDKSVDASTEH